MKLAAPLLLPLLLIGGTDGVCRKQGKETSLEQFMEEVRGALASHWELLQNLRYHTLGIKVRLVQLEAQIQNLSEHTKVAGSSKDTEDHDLRERGFCRNRDESAGDDAEQPEDNEMQDLLEAMRNLTEVYSTLASTNRLCSERIPEIDEKTPLGPFTIVTTVSSTDTDVKQEGNDENSYSTNVTALVGSTAVLNCRLDRLQDPEQVAWIRVRDQNWLSQGRHKVAASEGRISVDFSEQEPHYYRLFLEDVQSEDEGAYECHLSTTPTLRRIILLTVSDPPPSPPFLKHFPQDTLAVVGQDVTLSCTVTGFPKPSISWTRNNLQVTYSARYFVSPTGDLNIRGVRRGDAGRYVCRGVNSEGEAEGAALLTVRQPTKIVRPPRDRERLVGDKVVLRCRVEWDEGTPLLLEWLKNGEVIDYSHYHNNAFGNRFSLLPNNALVVSNVQLQDAGVYTCRASTTFDSTTAAATLTVLPAIPVATTAPATTSKTTTSKTTTTTTVLNLDYCPPPFERIQKYVCVLEVTHIKLSWDDAAEHCRSEGGQLAWEVDGKRVVQDFLSGRFGLGGSLTSTNTQWPFWVGGREGEDGEWLWMDGSPVAADLWAPHHRRPLGRRTGKDWCLMLDGYQGYLATALPCHSKRYFLCRLK